MQVKIALVQDQEGHKDMMQVLIALIQHQHQGGHKQMTQMKTTLIQHLVGLKGCIQVIIPLVLHI